MSNFIHLHVHSHYSLLDGLPKLDDIIDRAKELNMPSIALTDHGVMYGAVEFYQKALKAGIKPIIGVEAYVARNGRKNKRARIDTNPFHMILLAKNLTGYKNLLELTSRAHIEGFYYKPRIDYELLEQFSEGIIATTTCVQGHVPQLLLKEEYKEAEKQLHSLTKLFGEENFYLEVQHHPGVKIQAQVNQGIYDLASKFGLNLIATNDTHYARSEDDQIQDILCCIQTGKTVDEEDRLSMIGDDYSIKPGTEMAKIFADHSEALKNTLEIAEKCNVELELGKIVLPAFKVPKEKTPDEFLRHLCEEGIATRYGQNPENLKEIQERLDFELSVIAKMGYATYFLIVQDFVNYALGKNIVVGPGRGSAAGSIVAYLTNITDIDPLKYDLLFERFLNPERVSMPDIDLDFADVRRDEVINYVTDKYGKDKVAQIITFGTMAARAALRDVGRALGYAYDFCDRIAKMVPQFKNLEEALEINPEFKEIYENDPQATRMIDAAKKLEGVARHASVHACGVLITKEKLTNYVPLQLSTQDKESIVTQFPGPILENLGLLKMDFLGLKNLTIIERTLEIIKHRHDKDIDIRNIPLDDQKAYKLLQEGKTTGVFQLESSGMKRYLKLLKPTEFEDIIAMVSLYRPGPMEWIPDYIDGKHGKKRISYVHPKLEPILSKTYGVAIYQEQVMRIAQELAGFSLGQADILRKAMGKKIVALLMEQKNKFMEGCKANGVPEDIAKKVFEFIEPFAGYGFNRSHAACYAMIGYRTAYLKAHYPTEFMAALLTSDQENTDRVTIEISEAEQMGIEVLPPNINESFKNFTVIKENTIRFGLSAVKNVGANIVKEIVSERQESGKYKNLEDFLKRVQSKDLNKKSIEALSMAGALDEFADRNHILASIDKILAFTKASHKAARSGQKDLFGNIKNASSAPRLTLDPVKPASKKERLSWEKELLGVYVSEHPMDEYKDFVNEHTTPCSDLRNYESGETVLTAGVFTTMKKIITKSNKPMVFAGLEDHTGGTEVLVFPRVLEKYNHMCNEDTLVLVKGKLNDKDGEMKILADSLFELSPENIEKWKKESKNNPKKKKISKKEIHINLPSKGSRDFFLDLKNMLIQSPGDFSVFLKVFDPSGSKKLLKTEITINKNPDTIEKIEELVGKGNITEL